MSLEKALLADICARPEDDAPRLVYADWLEENGNPERAEFIRGQCELARKRLAGGAARRRELKKRVNELFNARGKGWAEAYGPWCADYLGGWERGFPEKARPRASLAELARDMPGMVEK